MAPAHFAPKRITRSGTEMGEGPRKKRLEGANGGGKKIIRPASRVRNRTDGEGARNSGVGKPPGGGIQGKVKTGD